MDDKKISKYEVESEESDLGRYDIAEYPVSEIDDENKKNEEDNERHYGEAEVIVVKYKIKLSQKE